jgi:hypothetical protein
MVAPMNAANSVDPGDLQAAPADSPADEPRQKRPYNRKPKEEKGFDL